MTQIPEPKFNNCVSVINIGQKLDLKKIYIISSSTEFNPAKMNVVIMKLFNPKATALIFSTGKIVCTGTNSEEENYKAALNILERIKQCGYDDAEIIDFQIQNLFVSLFFKFKKLALKIFIIFSGYSGCKISH